MPQIAAAVARERGRPIPLGPSLHSALAIASRGAEVAETTYDDRPREFTRDGLTVWLVDSGLDAGAAIQLADLAVEAREDLFPGDAARQGEAMSAPVMPWDVSSESAGEETPVDQEPGIDRRAPDQWTRGRP